MALKTHKTPLLKRLLTINWPLGFSLVFADIIVPVNVTVAKDVDPELSDCSHQPAEDVITSPLLIVLTLNMAHARLYSRSYM